MKSTLTPDFEVVRSRIELDVDGEQSRVTLTETLFGDQVNQTPYMVRSISKEAELVPVFQSPDKYLYLINYVQDTVTVKHDVLIPSSYAKHTVYVFGSHPSVIGIDGWKEGVLLDVWNSMGSVIDIILRNTLKPGFELPEWREEHDMNVRNAKIVLNNTVQRFKALGKIN